MASVISLLKLRLLVTFRNYTRSKASRIESFIFFPLFIFAMMNFHNALYTGFVYLASRRFTIAQVMVFDYFFLGLVLLWIIIPVMGFRLNESLDIKRLIHFPVTFPALFISLTLGNFFDISSISLITFLSAFFRFCVIKGSADGLIGILILCVIVFVFLQLIYQSINLLLYNLLPRFKPVKLVFLLITAGVVVMILSNMHIIKLPKEFYLLNDENLTYHNKLPTGVFGIAAYEFFLGNLDLANSFLIKSAMILIPVFLINGVVTYITCQNLELGIVRHVIKEPRRTRSVNGTSGVFENLTWKPVFAIALKDAKNFIRDWHYLFFKVFPGIITPTLIILIVRYLVFDQLWGEFNGYEHFIHGFLGFFILFLWLPQTYIFVSNIFGYERSGVSCTFTAPVSNRDILLGKNIFMFFLLTIDALVISALSVLFFSSLLYPVSFFILMENLIIIFTGLGNIGSLIYPFFVPFDKPSVGIQGTLIIGLMNIITIMILGITLLPIIIFLYLSVAYGNAFWLLLAALASFLYSSLIYRYLLKTATNLMPYYRESIYMKVTSA